MKKKKENKIKLAVLRESKGLSQRDLARETGISPSTIAAYEIGSRNPKLQYALILSNYFNVPIDQIKYGN